MSYKTWLKSAEGLLEGLDKTAKQVSARERDAGGSYSSGPAGALDWSAQQATAC